MSSMAGEFTGRALDQVQGGLPQAEGDPGNPVVGGGDRPCPAVGEVRAEHDPEVRGVDLGRVEHGRGEGEPGGLGLQCKPFLFYYVCYD